VVPSELWFHDPKVASSRAWPTDDHVWLTLVPQGDQSIQNKVYGWAPKGPRPPAGPQQSREPRLIAAFRPEFDGPGLTAFWISFMTTSGLFAALLLHLVWQVSPFLQNLPAILVVLPTFYGLVAFRRHEHRLMHVFTRGPRLVVLLTAIFSFAAAISLALQAPSRWYISTGHWVLGWRSLVWMVLCFSSAVTTLVATLGLRRARGAYNLPRAWRA
jgi:hypothetical protein